MNKKNLDELIINLNKNLTEIMCYVTSDYMIKSMNKEIKQKIFNNLSDAYNFLNNQKYLCINLEILLSSKKTYSVAKRKDIQKKYNIPDNKIGKFVFNKDNIRIFMHAFNIFYISDYYYICQSWKDHHEYKIIYKLNHDNYRKFIKKLIKYIKNYNTDPVKLFKLFKITSMSDQENNLVKFYLDYKLDYNMNMNIYYV
jgi:hypothetical protein